MASGILTAVLLGMLFFWQGEAALNLLGKEVTQPLIVWDMDGIKKFLDGDSKAWKACEENTKDVSNMRTHRAELYRCDSQLSSSGSIDPDDVDMDEVCKKRDDYKKCVHKNLKTFTDFCSLTGDVKDNLQEAERMHMEMFKTMCEEDHSLYKDYEKNGKQCVESKETRLKKCSSCNSEENMGYGKDDCNAARNFVKCVEKELEDCKTGASKAVVEMMDAGLEETECKNHKGVGGAWSVAPATFLTLIASFIPLVFVF